MLSEKVASCSFRRRACDDLIREAMPEAMPAREGAHVKGPKSADKKALLAQEGLFTVALKFHANIQGVANAE